ncbi:hypothetical protein LSAT2_022245 [Lamellibrachia satsuma]|nr:hypothetical protein LSAT2_022245 [Lamellibrachia satsuma]
MNSLRALKWCCFEIKVSNMETTKPTPFRHRQGLYICLDFANWCDRPLSSRGSATSLQPNNHTVWPTWWGVMVMYTRSSLDTVNAIVDSDSGDRRHTLKSRDDRYTDERRDPKTKKRHDTSITRPCDMTQTAGV